MAKEFIYQTSDLITSFSTKHPQALARRVPWIITSETKITDALDLLFEDEYADLVVLDTATGQVTGLLSNFETTSTLSSKKKKEKKTGSQQMQADCHQECERECADRNGCRSHGLAHYAGTGWICTIICNDDRGTVGEVLGSPPQDLPG